MRSEVTILLNQRHAAASVFLIAAFLMSAASGHAQELFIDTQALQRHAGQQLPPIVGLKELTAGRPISHFTKPLAETPNWAMKDVEHARSPIKAGGGFWNGPDQKYASVKAAAGSADGLIVGGYRTETARGYEDGDGNRVDWGYDNHLGHLFGRWSPRRDVTLTAVALSDYIARAHLPNYTMDATNLFRRFGKASLQKKEPSNFIDELNVDVSWYNMAADTNNHEIRPLTAVNRLIYPADQNIVRARAELTYTLSEELSGSTGADIRYNTLSTKRNIVNTGHPVTNAFFHPTTQEWWGGAFADLRYDMTPQTRIEGGVRLDVVSISAKDAHRVPTTGNALHDISPQTLYDTYYGTGQDTSTVQHNVSARLRLENEVSRTLTLFGDVRRELRPGDPSERYKAAAGPAAARDIGNPGLKPERHRVLEVGATFNSAAFAQYGPTRGAANTWRIEGSLRHDDVKDFITGDRARGQPGILKNDNAPIYRNVDARLSKVDLDIQWNVNENVSVRALSTYSLGRNTTDRRDLYQIPPFETDLFFDYGETFANDGFWHAGIRTRLVARQDRVDASTDTGLGQDTGGETGGFASVDLYGGMRLSDWFSLGMGVSNLTDKHYHEHINAIPQTQGTQPVNAPGRALWLQTTMAF